MYFYYTTTGLELQFLLFVSCFSKQDAQLEILKLYSTGMSDEELNELKKLLADNYAKKAIIEADKIWSEKKLSDKDMEKWLHEHR